MATPTTGRRRGRPAKTGKFDPAAVSPFDQMGKLGETGVEADISGQDTDVTDLDLAKKTLRDLMVSGETPAAAKAQAARTLLELIGALGRNAKPPADSDKPVNEMTRAELEVELAAQGG